LLALAEYADAFYYDFKLRDLAKFQAYIGGDAGVPLRNLAALRKKTGHITLRIPLIPDITDTADNVEAAYSVAKDLGIKHIHLLPYNISAAAKYEWIGQSWTLGELMPDKGHYEDLKSAAPDGLTVAIQY
jgi:pyruvate formate lyase activating enzyme